MTMRGTLHRFGLVKLDEPVSKPVPVTVGTLEMLAGAEEKEYAALAQRAGFVGYGKVTTELNFEQNRSAFREHLAENGISAYSANDVARYLWHMAPVGYSPVLIPMRERYDMPNEEARKLYLLNRQGRIFSNILSNPADNPAPYSKPIPKEVLLTIIKLKTPPFIASTDFFVTDFMEDARIYAKPVDPFLAVRFQNRDWYFIERWDEPMFRMSKEK